MVTEEAAAQPELDKELYVFNWSDYIDEELLPMYEEETTSFTTPTIATKTCWPSCKLEPRATTSSFRQTT